MKRKVVGQMLLAFLCTLLGMAAGWHLATQRQPSGVQYPELDPVPAIAVEPAEFTGEEARRQLQAFFDNQTVYPWVKDGAAELQIHLLGPHGDSYELVVEQRQIQSGKVQTPGVVTDEFLVNPVNRTVLWRRPEAGEYQHLDAFLHDQKALQLQRRIWQLDE